MKLLRKKLSNGMMVVMEKRELPVVSVCIANQFGAAFEESEVKGIAHFMEHLLFTGTKTRTHEDISREIEKKGGILNGFTSHELTAFWFKLGSEHLFSGLDILVDMVKNPKFDLEKFEKEKKVILEEIKMCHDNPSRHVIDVLEGNLYEKPFGERVIGNEKTINSMERELVVKYFSERYSPENYIAVIVGDADFEEVCEYFEREFQKGDKKIEVKEIKKKNAESAEEREGIDQAHFVFGVHAPLARTKEHYVLRVLDAYLCDGMSSRLFLEIREKRGLAYAVKSSIESEKNYSYYIIYVGTTKDKVGEVKKIILEEIAKINEMGEKELGEAKERVIGLYNVSQEESTEVMTGLLGEEMRGNAEDYYRYKEEIKKVKLGDVKRLAKSLIAGGFSTAAVVPK